MTEAEYYAALSEQKTAQEVCTVSLNDFDASSAQKVFDHLRVTRGTVKCSLVTSLETAAGKYNLEALLAEAQSKGDLVFLEKGEKWVLSFEEFRSKALSVLVQSQKDVQGGFSAAAFYAQSFVRADNSCNNGSPCHEK